MTKNISRRKKKRTKMETKKMKISRMKYKKKKKMKKKMCVFFGEVKRRNSLSVSLSLVRVRR